MSERQEATVSESLMVTAQFCYLKKLVFTACTWKITRYFVMSERQEATVSESLKFTA